MKVVRITDIKSNILEYTIWTKKIKAAEFIFTIEGNEYKKVAFLLDKKVFSIRLPFSQIQIRLCKFNKYSIEKQVESIERICKEYVNTEIEVGTYDDDDKFIDIKIEKAIKENILAEKKINILPPFFYILNGPILSHNEFNDFSEFVNELIIYYKLNCN